MILDKISIVLEIVAILLCINFHYSKKLRFGIYDVLFAALQIVVVTFANYYESFKAILVLSYLLIFIFQIYKYKISFGQCCLNLMLVVCLSVILQLISSIPALPFVGHVNTNILILCNNSINLVLILILGKFGLIHRISTFLIRREWLVKVAVVCCFIGAVYLTIVYKMDKYLRPTDYIIFLVWTIIIFVSVIGWQKSKEQYRIKKYELELTKVYDKYSQELLDIVIKRQHDFDNYIQALLGQMYIADSLEDLRSRYTDVITDIKGDNQYNKLLAGGNSLIVGFLYSKFVNAEKSGCNITYNVRTKDMTSHVPGYKIIELIGIIFDNAVEAVKDNVDKNIYVEILECDIGINVKISNPCHYVKDEELCSWFTKGISTKGDNHGIGLCNVRAIVEKYDIDLSVYNNEIDDINYLNFSFGIKK